jgi:hypothetical protein
MLESAQEEINQLLWKWRLRGWWIEASVGKSLWYPISTNRLDIVVCSCNPSYTRSSYKGYSLILAWAKTQDPIQKHN